jgi:hypothetical protein
MNFSTRNHKALLFRPPLSRVSLSRFASPLNPLRSAAWRVMACLTTARLLRGAGVRSCAIDVCGRACLTMEREWQANRSCRSMLRRR